MSEELLGRYRRTIWTNEEGSYLIGELDDGLVVKGPVTTSPPSFGLSYVFFGSKKKHPKYGEQFEFEAYKAQEPQEPDAVALYLIKMTKECGIGPVIAKRIVDEFGADKALHALRETPERVASRVKGLSEDNACKAGLQLKQLIDTESTAIELTKIFHGRGFPSSTIEQCISIWGLMAPDVIRRDPFKLIIKNVSGAGFSRCDTLYLDLGLPPDRLKRQTICLWYHMVNHVSGSVWFEIPKLGYFLQENVSSGNVSLSRALELGLRSGLFIEEELDGENYIGVKSIAVEEARICDLISMSLTNSRKPLSQQAKEKEKLGGLEALAKPANRRTIG